MILALLGGHLSEDQPVGGGLAGAFKNTSRPEELSSGLETHLSKGQKVWRTENVTRFPRKLRGPVRSLKYSCSR